MNDDDLKNMMQGPTEPATDLARHKTLKESSARFSRNLKAQPQHASWRYRAATLSLIAVSMFGALSYIVTQSTRSGAGSSDSETGLINSAPLTQYPASVRTAVVRMIIGGMAVEQLRFDAPADIANIPDRTGAVFAREVGGATYASALADVMANGQAGSWLYNMTLSLPGIGTNDPDLVAYLPGIGRSVCEKVNQQLGFSVLLPKLQSDQSALYTQNMVGGYKIPAQIRLLDAPSLQAQPFGCFESYDGKSFIYYHTLVER